MTLVVSTLTALSAAMIALVLYFGSYGDCRLDSDCKPGHRCMEWSMPQGWRHWWAKGASYRTCEIPCDRDQDCPKGHDCTWLSHGPGPRSHCKRSRE